MENKPLICKLLGVEVGEVWKYPVENRELEEFRVSVPYCYGVDGSGMPAIEIHDAANDYWEDMNDYFHSFTVLDIITHPEKIVHSPRWTAQDVEDAKMVKRLFPGIESVHRGGLNCSGLYIHDTCHYHINEDCFPGLKDGETALLCDILEAEKFLS